MHINIQNAKQKIKNKNKNKMSGTREREGRCVDENDLYQSSNSGISDMIWALMLWYVHWYYDTYVHWYYDMSITIIIWALISNDLSMESFYMINDITCGHAFVNFVKSFTAHNVKCFSDKIQWKFTFYFSLRKIHQPAWLKVDCRNNIFPLCSGLWFTK